MGETKLICGDCGEEMKQVGVLIKCQNSDCKAQVPIDVQAVDEARASYNTEAAEELPKD